VIHSGRNDYLNNDPSLSTTWDEYLEPISSIPLHEREMCAPQGSDFANIVGSAFMDFESVPQVLLSFCGFAAQF